MNDLIEEKQLATKLYLPVMDGTIDFDQLFDRLDKWKVAPMVATEIYGQGLIDSIDYLEKKMAATRCYGD